MISTRRRHHIFTTFVLVAGLIIGSLELGLRTPLANSWLVKADSASDNMLSSNEPISNYRSNLGENNINLPGHLKGALTFGSRAWNVDDVPAVRPYTSPRPSDSKHIPVNAIVKTYTTEMAESDSLLASIFGGPGAVAAANGFEPRSLESRYPLYRGDLISDDGRILRGHLSFAMHLYGSEDGTRETALYVPAGFVSNSNEPTPTDAAISFYYPKLGNLLDVTLVVFHVANFHLSYENGRVRIGNIGGPGGSIGSYKHSHIEFYRGDTGLPSASMRAGLRIDPVTVFSMPTARLHRVSQSSQLTASRQPFITPKN